MIDKVIVTGKRKASVARAVITAGTGKVTIDRQPYQVLPTIRRLMIEEPVRIAKEQLGDFKFDIAVTIRGGGVESRIEAARLAVARAIVEKTQSKELKKEYIAYDRSILVADTRRKEPYKPGDSKARAKRQKSYR